MSPYGYRERTVPKLDDAQLAELRRRYWETNDTIASIERAFKVPPNKVHSAFIKPLPAGRQCVVCGAATTWPSRSSKKKDDDVCISCGHHRIVDGCTCAVCSERRRVRVEAAEAARLARVQAAWDLWEMEYADQEHVEWALTQLTPPQRLFLSALVDVFKMEPIPPLHWVGIAADAGLQEQHAARWVKVLLRLGLLGEIENQVGLNPVLYRLPVLRPPRTGRGSHHELP